jgi:hypothetical protein
VVLVRPEVSDENISSVIREKRTSELGTALAVFLRSVIQVLVTANVVPSSPILVTMMMEAIFSS